MPARWPALYIIQTRLEPSLDAFSLHAVVACLPLTIATSTGGLSHSVGWHHMPLHMRVACSKLPVLPCTLVKHA